MADGPPRKRQGEVGALAADIVAMSRDLSAMERSTKLGQVIRQARQAYLDDVFERTRRGEIIARGLSAVTDQAILGLFRAGAEQFADEAARLAVVAIGGYGRERLAPYSDIDLLFLHGPNDGDRIKPLLDFILYALWDAGLIVSQSVRSPAGAVEFARSDMDGNTSLLDARYLAGASGVADDFLQRYDRHRKSSVPGFIEAKLKEREARIAKGAGSRYAVEPDIKEGKGGLRDLETLHWLSRYAYGDENVAQRVESGVFTEEEAASFKKALDFLWSVRVQLHRLRARPDEILSFDIQPDVAEALNYADRGQSLAAERLMKHYFINAKEVGRLTGVVCAALEEAEVKRSRLIDSFFASLGPNRTEKKLSRRIREDEAGRSGNITLRGDRLDFVDHAAAAQNPVDLFRLFRLAGRPPACEIHPEALKAVATGARFIKRADVQTPDVAALFRAIVLDTADTENVLRDMAESGLLGSYLPAFGMLIGRVKYGLYRAYTLDEHVLKSVGVLDRLRRGDAERDHPIATRIVGDSHDPLLFYLAILMHETAETLTQPTPDKLRRRIRASIGHLVQDRTDLDDVIWAASRYRLMAHMAVRRSVTEARTIETFADEVGSEQRLNMLTVLTVCHLRMAGHNSWDRWTRRDMMMLYQATLAWFRGGAEALERHLASERARLRDATAALLSDWEARPLDNAFDRLPGTFFEGQSAETAARFVRLMRRVDGDNVSGAATLELIEEDGLIEAVIYSRDKPGLYAAIAGAVIESGGVIRASTAFPVEPAGKGAPMAGNIVVFHGENGHNLVDGQDTQTALDQLRRTFEAAIARPGYAEIAVKRRVGDRRHVFDVTSEVRLDQYTSENCLIVEARGLDRPGLLYRLAAALSDIGVTIRSAYIATYGETAVDTFYVQDLPGYKITDRRRQEVIRRKLMAVLEGR